MAEIIKHDSRKRKFKIRSTRVDLTPMVDLGFLLITFFVFTTSLSEAKVMGMMMPDDSIPAVVDDIPQSRAITLVLKAGNTIEYYEGADPANIQITNHSSSGLRNILMKKEASLKASGKGGTIVIIKPTDSSTFENLVSVMDELAICRIKKYYVE